MMKGCILLIIFISLCPVGIQCRNVPEEEPPALQCIDDYESTFVDQCFPGGGGFGRWKCIKTDKEKHIYKWIKIETVTCSKEQSGCQCFPFGDWEDIECECYNPTAPPSFPPNGIIRWSGREIYDSDYYVHYEKPRTVRVFGEVHKNTNGNFLLNRTVLEKWNYFDHYQIPNVKILFDIYVPDGLRFKKYSGEHGNRTCTMSQVTQTSELSSIWNTGVYRGRPYRLKQNKLKEGSIYTQIWGRFEQGPDYDISWSMTMEYDREKKYAIPIKYYYRLHDGFGGELHIQRQTYTYESVNDGDESFQVGDFCDNV